MLMMNPTPNDDGSCRWSRQPLHLNTCTNLRGIEAGNGGKDAETKTNRPTPAAAASCSRPTRRRRVVSLPAALTPAACR